MKRSVKVVRGKRCIALFLALAMLAALAACAAPGGGAAATG